MTQALTRIGDTALQQVANLTIKDIKEYLCPKATDAECYMFLMLCQAQTLNPWLREAYLIKYKDNEPATMVVGKDTFTKRAEYHEHYTGFKAGVIVAGSDGAIIEREGTFFAIGEKLAGGWADVYRDDRTFPIRATVNLDEYSTGFSNWKSKPATMIRKVALVQALREAFPVAFAGLYDAAEMGIDPDTLEGEVVRREDTAPASRTNRLAARTVDAATEPAQPKPPVTLTHCPEHPDRELQQSMLPEYTGPGHVDRDASDGWCDAATVINDRLLALLGKHAAYRKDVDELLVSKNRPPWAELSLAQQHVTLSWLDTQLGKRAAQAS